MLNTLFSDQNKGHNVYKMLNALFPDVSNRGHNVYKIYLSYLM